jgi:nicotinamidase-related amidase
MESWNHPNPDQVASGKMQAFARGSYGGEWYPDFALPKGDITIKEHWAQNGFANPDLDFQLKQHGIAKVIVIGPLANTCIESTGRYAMELGYHVTLVTDATAAFSKDQMEAAHELNGPNFATPLPMPVLVLIGEKASGNFLIEQAKRRHPMSGVRLLWAQDTG